MINMCRVSRLCLVALQILFVPRLVNGQTLTEHFDLTLAAGQWVIIINFLITAKNDRSQMTGLQITIPDLAQTVTQVSVQTILITQVETVTTTIDATCAAVSVSSHFEFCKDHY